MNTKKVKVEITGPAAHTHFELESDSKQGVIHVVFRDFDSAYNEMSATGSVLTVEELEEINIAISEVIQHQKRSANQ